MFRNLLRSYILRRIKTTHMYIERMKLYTSINYIQYNFSIIILILTTPSNYSKSCYITAFSNNADKRRLFKKRILLKQ